MRLRYLLLLLLIVLSGYFIYQPDDFRLTQQFVSKTYKKYLIEKRVSLRGLRTLRPEAIYLRLPTDRSIPWWILNTDQIEAMLTQISYIQNADIQPCEKWILPWGCFIIDIAERSPTYLTTTGSDMLVLGDDGAVIVSFPVNEIEARLGSLLDPGARKPMMLLDMITPGVSSDVVNARFSYLSSAAKSIEQAAQVEVTRMQLLHNGEIIARIGVFPFDIQFDATQDNVERLNDEALRLKRLLVELKGRELDVKKIDLAFDKLAVVTYTDEYLKLQAAQTKAFAAEKSKK